MLEKMALQRAVLHLSRLGDTDIFPPLFEFVFYADSNDKVVDVLSKLDVASYLPKSCFEVLTPKRKLSFRIAHQLYPTDTLLYTSAVIQIAPAIEALRLPSEKGPFSYRFVDDPNEPRLFSDSSSFHDWLIHVKSLCSGGLFDDAQYVLETDISDFYARIYFHRLEHVLDDCEAPNAVRKVIEGIIKATRARQSYGLPVGSAASRLLAEGLLNDTDRMISDRAASYSRYVDDFRIIVDKQSEVHTILCRLAEHLMLTEGLSLNSSKTRESTGDELARDIDGKLNDVFNDDELVQLSQYVRQVYEDEEVSAEDIEEVEPERLLEKLKEVLDNEIVDFAAVRVILKALRAVKVSCAMDLLVESKELLYFVPRDYCMLAGALAQRNPDEASAIAEFLVSNLKGPPYSEMALSRIWVVHLFVTQALPLTRILLEALDLSKTAIEQRQKLILLGILKDRGFFRERKTRFNEASDWEKPALMLGASCLARGEYGLWLDTVKNHYHDPLADVYRQWLKENQSTIFDKLKVQFWVKNREERQAEVFAAELDEEMPF